MILGQTRGERFRTAATAVFLALTGVYLGVCLVAEQRQEAGYRSALMGFAGLTAAYAKQHGFEPQEGGWHRHPYWREGRYSMYLVKGNEELYIIRGAVLCEWFGAKLHRVEIGFPPFGEGRSTDIAAN